MRLISAQAGRLVDTPVAMRQGRRVFQTGLAALDALVPAGLARGAVHELLWNDRAHPVPLAPAILLASAAMRSVEAGASGQLVVIDDDQTFFPPAVRAWGIVPEQLLLIRPNDPEQSLWALAECLRCSAITAVIARPGVLSRIDARRLQLAAEAGGSVGLLIRPTSRAHEYAAATRWVVTPAPGDVWLQRWTLQLIHGHGGHIGKTIVLERSRETHLLRATEQLADRSREAEVG